jgi:shikimate dehydrogenase
MSSTRDEGKDSPKAPLLLALLGDERVFKSPSPKMHTAALERMGLKGNYIPLKVKAKALPSILPALHELGFTGLNVTAPLKEAVIPYLTSISETAENIGAVNTLIYNMQGYYGANTDSLGFSTGLIGDLESSRVLVLGSGGAARAVIHALLAENFIPVLSARDPKKAELLASKFRIETVPWEEIEEPFHVIVNACGVSSEKDFNPPPKTLRVKKPNSKIIDLNYHRENNLFQKLALENKVPFSDGLPMLAHQARLSFKAWIDSSAPVPLEPFLEAIKAHAEEEGKK